MNYYPYGGYQSRRSGTGGGCGCGCNGGSKGWVSGGGPYAGAQVGPQVGFHYGSQAAPHGPSHYQMPNHPIYPPMPDQLMPDQQMYPPMPNQIMYQQSVMPKPIDNPAPSQTLLKLLEEAVAGEKEDRIFYQQLIDLSPTTAEKDIIAGIRDDEIAHFTHFRTIYRELSGKEISSRAVPSEEDQPLSYIANLRKALFGEIAAVKKYRKIRAELTSKRHRDILFDIITDELTHVGKYNYLITINKRN